MLVPTQLVSVDPHEMSWAETTLALATSLCGLEGCRLAEGLPFVVGHQKLNLS